MTLEIFGYLLFGCGFGFALGMLPRAGSRPESGEISLTFAGLALLMVGGFVAVLLAHGVVRPLDGVFSVVAGVGIGFVLGRVVRDGRGPSRVE